jgi:hypothetical protein
MALSSSRRQFLKAIGLGSLAAATGVAFRPGIRQARAAEIAVAKRFVALKYCNGTRYNNWWPVGEGAEFPLAQLPPLLAPFERVKDKLLVFKGLKLSASLGPGGSHNAGMCTFLTGTEMQKVGSAEFRSGGSISLDQHLADHIGKDTRFSSLVTGVQPGGGAISYRGRLQPVMPDGDPLSVYRRLFSGIVDQLGNPLPAEEVERLRLKRKSILDHTARDLATIESQLSGPDRQRMQLHLDSIRRMERGFEVTQSCARPAAPPVLDLQSHANIPTISRMQLDLIVLALSCQLTNIATLTWSRGAGQFTFPWLGIDDVNQHGLSHTSGNDVAGQERYQRTLRWLSEEMAYLMERMDEIVETDGQSLLHHSVVLVGTDNGQGNGHNITNIPFLMAGRAGGVFRTGRFIEYPANTAHNGLLISIANAMGAPVETFGNPAYCSGPLPLLT